jgi:aspartyl protease family protein
VVGALAPRLADHFLPKSATSKAAAVTPRGNAPSMPSGARTVTIPRDNRGHFQVDGVVDGRRIGFLVDTGASLVILTQRDASRLGFHPSAREHTAVVNTANGKVRAAPVRLAMVEVGGVSVRNVEGLVMPDEALSENLLGMSFLTRLRRFEFREGRLVLEE